MLIVQSRMGLMTRIRSIWRSWRRCWRSVAIGKGSTIYRFLWCVMILGCWNVNGVYVGNAKLHWPGQFPISIAVPYPSNASRRPLRVFPKCQVYIVSRDSQRQPTISQSLSNVAIAKKKVSLFRGTRMVCHCAIQCRTWEGNYQGESR